MKINFLLISDRDKTAWSDTLSDALSPLGSLRVVSEHEAGVEILRASYGLVIIDAAVIEEPAHLVSHLRTQRPELRIVVVAVTPTWQEARAVWRAGAADYFPRPPNKEELLLTMRDTFNRLSLLAPD